MCVCEWKWESERESEKEDVRENPQYTWLPSQHYAIISRLISFLNYTRC